MKQNRRSFFKIACGSLFLSTTQIPGIANATKTTSGHNSDRTDIDSDLKFLNRKTEPLPNDKQGYRSSFYQAIFCLHLCDLISGASTFYVQALDANLLPLGNEELTDFSAQQQDGK